MATQDQPLTSMEKIMFLKESSFFAALPLEELYHIALSIQEESAREGSVVIKQGTRGGKMYIVIEGELEVSRSDPDVEGEAQCGSVEVEERNVMARTVTTRADAVVVVGSPGVKGLHGLVRTVNALREHGVAPERMLAVVDRSARTAKGRAELTRTFADLSGARVDGVGVVGPVHVPERRGLDEVLRDGARLPASVTDPLVGALAGLLERATTPVAADAAPVPVAPGSLGSWAEEEVAG